MSDPDQYIALVSSLPISERLFVAKQPPLTRIKLDRRLKALTEDHSHKLALIEGLLSWSSYGMDVDTATVVAQTKFVLSALDEPTLKDILRERMELRSAIACLRLRAAGGKAPKGDWMFGRWARHITSHWTDPTFGLDNAMPWLRDVVSLIEKRDPLELQRHILGTTFQQLHRHAANHQFDFEAVVIYVLKWSIFDRWSKSNAEAATRRFQDLLDSALVDFPEFILEREAT